MDKSEPVNDVTLRKVLDTIDSDDARKRIDSEVSHDEMRQRMPSEVSPSNEYSMTDSTLTAAVEGLISEGCPCHQLREDGPSLMLQDQPGHVNPASKFLESYNFLIIYYISAAGYTVSGHAKKF